MTATSYQVNLLDPGDLYGEGYFIADLKLAKNIRFANKRVNVGVDVYNLFNNDAIRAYQATFTPWTTRRRRGQHGGSRRRC